MPSVEFMGKTHNVDDDLYKNFLSTLMSDPLTGIEDFMNELGQEEYKELQDYIIFRLVEVDPGYVPPMEQYG